MALSVWQATVQDKKGNALPGASVYVTDPSSGEKIAIYSDEDGALSLSNPFTADSVGFVQFYASPQKVDIMVYSGSDAISWSDVILSGSAAYIDQDDIIIKVDSIAGLADLSVTDGQVVFIPETGHYQYDLASDDWIPVSDASITSSAAESAAEATASAAAAEISANTAQDAVENLSDIDATSDIDSIETHDSLIGNILSFMLSDSNGNLGLSLDSDGTLTSSELRVIKRLLGETYEISENQSDYAFALTDSGDNLGFAVANDGQILTASGASIEQYQSDWDFAIVDSDGYVGLGIKGGSVYPQTSATNELISKNERNKSYSEAVKLASLDTQLPTADYNIVMNYGQSIGEGSETWPSLSKTPQSGALMVGDNVDNQSASTTYTTIGTAAFNPLVAYTASGGANLSDAEELALTAGDQAKGEPPVIGLANSLKGALNSYSFSEDNGKNIVAMSSAQAGKTIEQLSKINTQDSIDRYSGVTAGISLAMSIDGSSTFTVPVITWIQGEYDYAATWGSTNTTRALYSSAMNTLFDDLSSDSVSLTGQSKSPLFLTYQTGAAYTFDTDTDGNAGLHVGMAQLDVALDRGDTVMFGPAYPYTDKGGHLDSNGSRWMGHQMAKVARKVFLGQGWEPLRPIEITTSSNVVYVSFHVPVPPLRFSDVYVVSAATDYVAKGFRVTSSDGATTYGISGVEITNETIVKITLDSEPPTDALVWYADKAIHNGNGNLCDSDPELAIDLYEYVPERGMYEAANITELVGNKYPLQNWCVAFSLPITYSEF